MKFYEKLTNQRKLNNYSQEQLADLVGVSRQAVSKWENGESYPDMTKIIQLCSFLNCRINDLLDDGLLDDTQKSDENDKKVNQNNYFQDFLNVITRIYNMIISMNWKSRLVMISEMLLLAAILCLSVVLINEGVYVLLRELIGYGEYEILYIIRRIIGTVILCLLIAVSVIIFMHIFKIRYLDYYVTIEDATVKEIRLEEPIEENVNDSVLVKKKISPKIIIRDPKHSISRFFELVGKIFIFFFKAILACCCIPALGMLLVFLIIGVLAVINLPSGIVFADILMIVIGLAAMTYLILHFSYDILMSVKHPHKLFIIIIVSALLITSVGTGFLFNRLSNFENEQYNENNSYKKSFVIDNFDKNTKINVMNGNYKNVHIIIDDSIDNIVLNTDVRNGYNIELGKYENDGITDYWFNIYLQQDTVFGVYHMIIDDLKNGVLSDIFNGSDCYQVEIRISQKNYELIEILG